MNNTIEDITEREPFPGNVLGPRRRALEWSKANGSGIWISPDSDGNEITGNTFEDIATYAVFIEGDKNRVEVIKVKDSARDMGADNLVTGARNPKQ